MDLFQFIKLHQNRGAAFSFNRSQFHINITLNLLSISHRWIISIWWNDNRTKNSIIPIHKESNLASCASFRAGCASAILESVFALRLITRGEHSSHNTKPNKTLKLYIDLSRGISLSYHYWNNHHLSLRFDINENTNLLSFIKQH